MEEDINFKTLFLQNLYLTVSHYLDVMACPHTMTAQQLQDIAHKTFSKQKIATEKATKATAVMTLLPLNAGLALEGAQYPDHGRSFNDRFFSNRPFNNDKEHPANRERDYHTGARSRYQKGRPTHSGMSPGNR